MLAEGVSSVGGSRGLRGSLYVAGKTGRESWKKETERESIARAVIFFCLLCVAARRTVSDRSVLINSRRMCVSLESRRGAGNLQTFSLSLYRATG